MRRNATRIQELTASERLLRTGNVLDEIQRRFVWTHNAKHRVAIGAAADRGRVQSSRRVHIVQTVEVRALKDDSRLPVNRTGTQPGYDFDELIVIDLEED